MNPGSLFQNLKTAIRSNNRDTLQAYLSYKSLSSLPGDQRQDLIQEAKDNKERQRTKWKAWCRGATCFTIAALGEGAIWYNASSDDREQYQTFATLAGDFALVFGAAACWCLKKALRSNAYTTSEKIYNEIVLSKDEHELASITVDSPNALIPVERML